MIPKIIHYCWFGKNKKSEKVERCLKTINKLSSFGYKIIEWNEDNYNVDVNVFLKTAYENKKWAFVSDYVRLDVLYRFGGVYLDADVEIVKCFDDLLENNLFLGYMWDCNLGTAVIGAEPNNYIIHGLLEKYDSLSVSLNSPNNDPSFRS